MDKGEKESLFDRAYAVASVVMIWTVAVVAGRFALLAFIAAAREAPEPGDLFCYGIGAVIAAAAAGVSTSGFCVMLKEALDGPRQEQPNKAEAK